MRTNLLSFVKLFAVQFVNYALLCWNYRSVAQARYAHVFASDLFCAAVSFWLIRRVVRSGSRWEAAGYVAGGAVGSVASVWVTRTIWNS